MKKLCGTVKKIMGAGLVCLALGTVVVARATAEEAKPTADFTTSFYSQYVWRGFGLSKDSLVIQPSMTVAYNGFSANLWGNLDTDHFITETSEFNETDMTLSYSGSVGKLGYSLGYIYYGLEAPAVDSQEIFAGVSIDTLFKPSLTVYKEFANYSSYYFMLSVAQDIPLGQDVTLTLGGHLGYLLSQDASAYPDENGEEFNNFHDGLLLAAVSFPINSYMKVKAELDYSFDLCKDASDLIRSLSVDHEDNFLYGGVAVSMSF